MSTELNNGTNVAANNKIMLINDNDTNNTNNKNNNKNITAIVENKPTTTDEKNNTNTTHNTTPSDSKYSLSINSNIIKYIIISITVIILIALAIYITYKTYSTQNKNLGTLLEEARKDVAILSGNVKTLEQEKQMYINKINQLNNELRASQTQYDNNYSNILPMTENSYDAPEPNKEKTKVITEREAIQRLVNSKRKTVQDEIDAKKAAEEEKQQKDTRIIKSEISDNILHKPNDKSNNKHKNSDNEYDDDESKVNEILSLVGN